MIKQTKLKVLPVIEVSAIQLWTKWALAPVVMMLFATTLLLSSVDAQAVNKPNQNEQWTEWKALGSGYLARKKVPEKFNNSVTERQSSAVQAKLKALQKRLQTQTNKSRVDQGLQALGQNQRQSRSFDIADFDDVNSQLEQLNKDRKALARATPALWLRTGVEGVYEVALTDLANEMAIDPSIIRRLAGFGMLELKNAENPVSWYFDSVADSLIFVGETYDTFFTDENAYYFRPNSNNGQPMLESINMPTVAIGSELAFNESLKFEEEPDLVYALWTVKSEPDADYWFWDFLFGGFKDLIEVPLNIPNPAATGSAQLQVTLRGWTDLEAGDEHQVFAELNGVAVGSPVTWDGFDEIVLVADFDQSLLDPTGNNTLQLRNIYDDGTHPGQWLDQVEIDYARLPVAVDGKLWLHDIELGVQTVTGFTSQDILVFESPEAGGVETILRRDGRVESDGLGGYKVTFTAVGGVDYLVAERSTSTTALLEADELSTLNNSKEVADYMIIAPREFTGTAQALASYRRNKFGFVKIVWLDEIYKKYNAGREDPQAITRFMEEVNQTWPVLPAYMMLIGKGSLDHKNRMGYGDSFLPVVFTDTPWVLAPSDDRLLGGNGDAPFAIGRLPITNDGQGIAYVDKLIAHEASVPGSQYFDAVLVADDDDKAGDFHANSDAIATRLTDSLGFLGTTKLYHPDNQVRNNLILSSTWDNAGYISYDGHGSATQAGTGSEDFIKVTDAEVLTNSSYPIFTGLTCAVGDFSLPGMTSLAAALVLNPGGGAIASISPTGLSLDLDAQILGNAFVDNLYNGNNTIGNAVDQAKQQTQGSTFAFMQRIYTVIGEPAINGR